MIDVLFRQRILACSGFYTGKLDSQWGPQTEAADKAFNAEYLRLQTIGGTFDLRTEGVIITLLPKMQIKAREFMRVSGSSCKLISGTRTYAEQHGIFLQRPKVTNADSGQSNHNFGIAFDVGIFQGGHYLSGATKAEEQAYIDLGAKIKSHIDDLAWGGDWKSIIDKPHYELPTGKTLVQVRKLFESGKPYI